MQSIVKIGYNAMARSYSDSRAQLKSGKYVQKLLKLLPRKSLILDIGCGAGEGVDDILLKAGHEVVGIDSSVEMIRLARKNCPSGEFSVMDMLDLTPKQFEVGALVSFYALFHIPRTKHLEMLKIWASFLPKNGLLLITMGDRAFEGSHILHGVAMWSSQWGSEKNRELIVAAGLEIICCEIDTSGGERHLVVLARKH